MRRCNGDGDGMADGVGMVDGMELAWTIRLHHEQLLPDEAFSAKTFADAEKCQPQACATNASTPAHDILIFAINHIYFSE